MLLVVLAGALAYGPTLDNGFLNLDDGYYVVDNPMISGGLNLRSLKWALTADVFEDVESVDYWQPATLVSRLIDGTLYGLNPAGHHFTSLLFHLANAVLLLNLLAAATGRLWPSAVVALVFVAHPLHVSSVAWVTERKDVLSVFFSFLSLGAFAQFAAAYQAQLTGRADERSGGRVVRWYLLLAAGYTLSLMSKPMALPLPFVMLLVAAWPIPRDRRPGLGRLALCLAPLLLLAAAATFLYTRVSFTSSEIDKVDVHSLFPIAKSIVTSLAAYPVRLLYPVHLQHIYSVHPGVVTSWQVAGSLLLLGAVTVMSTVLARRRPFLAVGWLWYLVSLVPVAMIFRTNAAADRFSYFPLIGVTVMIVWGVSELAGRRLPTLRTIGAAAIIIALVFTTRAECRYWKNSLTLFSHLLELDPKHDIAQRILGITMVEAGDYDKALELFQAVRSSTPSSPTASFNIGVALHHLGRLDEALQYYAEAVRLDPGYYWAEFNRGMIFVERGEREAALASFQATLRSNPRAAAALREIGSINALQGRFDVAAEYYRRALAVDPGDVLAKEKLRAIGDSDATGGGSQTQDRR